MASRAGVAVVVAASALLLVGCSASPPPSGLSSSEREAFRISRLDSQWRLTRLPSSLRPVVTSFEYLRPGERTRRYNECINELSPGSVYSSEANRSLEIALTGGHTEAQILVEYECSARYPFRPEDLGFFGAAQLAAIYDYYDRWLVPCLYSRGFTVTSPLEQPPTVLTSGYVQWNPLNSITGRSGDPRAALGGECKPYPDFVDSDEATSGQ
jgi:hypothetical protein